MSTEKSCMKINPRAKFVLIPTHAVAVLHQMQMRLISVGFIVRQLASQPAECVEGRRRFILNASLKIRKEFELIKRYGEMPRTRGEGK